MHTSITPEISIGNSGDSIKSVNADFDAILNVAIDLDIKDEFKYRHKVGLIDGPGNNPYTFIAAVLMLHSLVTSNKKVLIHCHAGKSRSVMVTSAYISIVKNLEFDAVLKEVMIARNVDIYVPALHEMATACIPEIKKLILT